MRCESNAFGQDLPEPQDLGLEVVGEFLLVAQLDLRFVLWRVARARLAEKPFDLARPLGSAGLRMHS
jgi:hypothetical protein